MLLVLFSANNQTDLSGVKDNIHTPIIHSAVTHQFRIVKFFSLHPVEVLKWGATESEVSGGRRGGTGEMKAREGVRVIG
jgi:hypothetical protein